MKPVDVDVQWSTSTTENYYFGGQKFLLLQKSFYQFVYLAEGLVLEYIYI